jgi:hypothetical protein
MGAPRYWMPLRDYLDQNTYRKMTVNELYDAFVHDVPLPKRPSVAGVRNVLYRYLPRLYPGALERINKTNFIWKGSDVPKSKGKPVAKRAPAQPLADPDQCYEAIGKTLDGDLILRDTDGLLYRAAPLS